MPIILHFLNGNDSVTQDHYFQKEYRNDIIVEISGKFYEVYFFVKDVLEYEMTKKGFFSLPGIIILDEIKNDKIFDAINSLVDLNYFSNFVGYDKNPINSRFVNEWYMKSSLVFRVENKTIHMLRE